MNTARKGCRDSAGESGDRLARARGGAQEVAGADVLGEEPQQPRARRSPPTTSAVVRHAAPRGARQHQPQPVEAEERPHLRAQQPGGEAEQERVARAGRRGGARSPTGTSATSRPSELPRAKLRMNSSASSSATAAITPADRPGEPRARAGRPSRARAARRRARRRSHSCGARRRPSSENGVVKMTGSGFHDGPPVVDEVQVDDLAAPDQPRPRVVGRQLGAEQRERREREAGEHEQPPGRAAGPAPPLGSGAARGAAGAGSGCRGGRGHGRGREYSAITAACVTARV